MRLIPLEVKGLELCLHGDKSVVSLLIELWSSLHIILIFRFSRVASIAGIPLLLVGRDVDISAQFCQSGVRVGFRFHIDGD